MSAAGTDSPKKRTNTLVYLDVLALWHTDLPTEEIAKKLKVTQAALQDYGRRHKLPRRTHVPRRSPNTRIIDPTPEEIAERAAECRARRTETENARLMHYKQKPVEVRQYTYSSRTGLFSEIG